MCRGVGHNESIASTAWLRWNWRAGSQGRLILKGDPGTNAEKAVVACPLAVIRESQIRVGLRWAADAEHPIDLRWH